MRAVLLFFPCFSATLAHTNLRGLQAPVPNEDLLHVPFSSLLLLDLAKVSVVEALHLHFEGGRNLYANVDSIMQGSCNPCMNYDTDGCCNDAAAMSSCWADVSLSNGFSLKVTLSGLSLSDKKGEKILAETVDPPVCIHHAHTLRSDTVHVSSSDGSAAHGDVDAPVDAAEPSPRVLAVAGCHGAGCGAVRISPFTGGNRGGACTFRTGIYGEYDPCNTPAIVGIDYYDPVRAGILGPPASEGSIFLPGGQYF